MRHFVFWGLFVAATAILVGYIVWMRVDESRTGPVPQDMEDL